MVEKVGHNGLVKEKYQGFVVGKDSVRQGLYKLYYDDGRVHQEGYYYKGKPDSVWITYFPKGPRKSRFVYDNGLKSGDFTFWNFDGSVYQSGYYLSDKLEGELITYHPSGRIDSKSHYKNGMLNGLS